MLRLPGSSFEPEEPAQRARLLSALGAAPTADLNSIQGPSGGLNEGIWFIRDGRDTDLVLKAVRGYRRFACEPTESEHLLTLLSEYPAIAYDPIMAFPSRVLQLRCDSGSLGKDLIVMRRAAGKPLASVMADWKVAGRLNQLTQVIQEVGETVGILHARYGGKQHGDLQASNVFYDEATWKVTLIDLGGMGEAVIESDEVHFVKSLQAVVMFYGPVVELWCTAFRTGLVLGKQKAAYLSVPTLPTMLRANSMARQLSKKFEMEWLVSEAPAAPERLRRMPGKAVKFHAEDSGCDEVDDEEDVPACEVSIFGGFRSWSQAWWSWPAVAC